jgi:hypothetical protein
VNEHIGVKRGGEGPSIGLLLGLANTAVVAAGLSAAVGHRDFIAVAMVTFLLGGLPAVLTGAALGRLADRISAVPVWVRRIAITVPAWLVVIALGRWTGMWKFAALACIPTTAAAFALEQLTRAKPAAASARVVVR